MNGARKMDGMKMRLLEVSDDQIEAVQNLVRFASEEENWYYWPGSNWVPGDRPEYCLHLNTYRCVFTYTKQPHMPVTRHLSISVPSDLHPSEIAVYTIASWFGFTGGKEDEHGVVSEPGDWTIAPSEAPGEHCIVVVQII